MCFTAETLPESARIPSLPTSWPRDLKGHFRELAFLPIDCGIGLLKPNKDSFKPFVVLCLVRIIHDDIVHLTLDTRETL